VTDAAALAGESLSGQSYTDRYLWYVIALLSVVNLFSYMDRMALSVLARSIKADLGFSDAQLGLLTLRVVATD
jgi:sugar phosphate permease